MMLVPSALAAYLMRALVFWLHEHCCDGGGYGAEKSRQLRERTEAGDGEGGGSGGEESEDSDDNIFDSALRSLNLTELEKLSMLEDEDIDAAIVDLRALTGEVVEMEERMRLDMRAVGSDFDAWMRKENMTPAAESKAYKRLQMLEALKAQRAKAAALESAGVGEDGVVSAGAGSSSDPPAVSRREGAPRRALSPASAARADAAVAAVLASANHKANLGVAAEEGVQQKHAPSELRRRAVTGGGDAGAGEGAAARPELAVVGAFEGSAYTAKWREWRARQGRAPAWDAVLPGGGKKVA